MEKNVEASESNICFGDGKHDYIEKNSNAKTARALNSEMEIKSPIPSRGCSELQSPLLTITEKRLSFGT